LCCDDEVKSRADGIFCTYHLDSTVGNPVDEPLELGNITACEDRAVHRINDEVVVLSLGVECEEVVEGRKDLLKTLGFGSLLKVQDCLDQGHGGCGILKNLRVKVSV